MEQYTQYLSYHLRGLETNLAFYSRREVQKLQWKTFIKKQKAFVLLRRLLLNYGSTNNTVIIFGACDKFSGAKGHAGGPVKEFRCFLKKSNCQVVDLDEYKTSQLCSLCHEQLKSVYTSKTKGEGETMEVKRRILHGVKCCISAQCRTSMLTRCEAKTFPWVASRGRMWNRDINAARNMLHIYQELLATGERPVPFRRNTNAPVEEEPITIEEIAEEMEEESLE